MQCPHCRVDLLLSVRQDVEIDYCPKCRGVWLDRGELDKIIERSTRGANDDRYEEKREAPVRYRDDDSGRYPKQQKSWLREIFD